LGEALSGQRPPSQARRADASVNLRTLVALWKANVPHWVWLGSPAWIGAVLLGLDGRAPEWLPLVLFIATVLTIQAAAEFANSYTDRKEDRLFGPTNTLVTGELDASVAWRVLILQNIVAAVLLVALVVVTLNYGLAVVILLGWFFGLAYSVPPLRLKETLHAPFSHAMAFALLPVAGWLIVQPSLLASNGFVLGFFALLFLHSYGLGITLKFRKTLLAFEAGLVPAAEGGSMQDLGTVGLNVRFGTAMGLEEITSLGAFVLVPLFWLFGVFDPALSIALLALPFPLTALALVLRRMDPLGNSSKYKVLMTLAWGLIVVTLFGAGLAASVHWGFAVLACIAVLAGFPLLVRIVHPWGAKSLSASY
jgi:1,4-dihydroxy-2-naphthoate octaprenyltransferase